MSEPSDAAGTWEKEAPGQNYQRGLVPGLFQPWVLPLVELAGLRPGERVLDVACGTGVVARTALTITEAVTGLDLNPGMLAVARSLTPTIDWRQASALDMGLPDAAFDVVFCQQGLQFFPDRAKALREIHRVLAPGGRLALSVWCDPSADGYPPFAAVLSKHVPDIPAAAGFVRAVFGLADPAELRALLQDAGFGEIEISRQTRKARFSSARGWAEAFFGAIPVPALATIEAPVRERIVAEVTDALRHLETPAGFAFDVSALVALARVAP